MARRVLTHNHRHIQHVYNDSTSRDDTTCTRGVDLYFNLSPGPLRQELVMSVHVSSKIALPKPANMRFVGAPPQSHKACLHGRTWLVQEGYNHAEGASGQLLAGIKYIQAKRPSAFVFERLKAFTWGFYRPTFQQSTEDAEGNQGRQWVKKLLPSAMEMPGRDGARRAASVPAARVHHGNRTRKTYAPLYLATQSCNRSRGRFVRHPYRPRIIARPLCLFRCHGHQPDVGHAAYSGPRGDPLIQGWVIDCRSDQANAVAKERLPCLPRPGNCGREGGAGLYVTNRGRMLTTTELLRLSGINPLRLHVPPNVSEAQFLAMARATVCVPLLARVTINLCKALGIVPQHEKVGPCSNINPPIAAR